MLCSGSPTENRIIAPVQLVAAADSGDINPTPYTTVDSERVLGRTHTRLNPPEFR